jgi:hypothetical protein
MRRNKKETSEEKPVELTDEEILESYRKAGESYVRQLNRAAKGMKAFVEGMNGVKPTAQMRLTPERALNYIDAAIEYWRASDEVFSLYYVDAFQSVRSTFFGKLLPVEGEEEIS